MNERECVVVGIGPIPPEDWPRVFNAVTGTHNTEPHPYRIATVEECDSGNVLRLRIPIGEDYSFTDRFQVLMSRLGRAGLL